MTYLGIIITYVFVSNLILTQFLGLCPFIGVSRRLSSALGMGSAVTFVMTTTSLVTSLLFTYVLTPLNLEFLRTVTFILVIASFVQLVEMVIHRFSPPLYKSLGIYLPLITTNCAVMGIALINVRNSYGILESLVAGLSAGIGFTLAILVLSGIREHLAQNTEKSPIGEVPLAFVSAGLMALAFMAFDRALLKNLIG